MKCGLMKAKIVQIALFTRNHRFTLVRVRLRRYLLSGFNQIVQLRKNQVQMIDDRIVKKPHSRIDGFQIVKAAIVSHIFQTNCVTNEASSGLVHSEALLKEVKTEFISGSCHGQGSCFSLAATNLSLDATKLIGHVERSQREPVRNFVCKA